MGYFYLPIKEVFENILCHTRPPWEYDLDTANTELCNQLQTKDLSGFGVTDFPIALQAAGALLQYVKYTQRASLPHIKQIHYQTQKTRVLMDRSTRKNLEITENLNGEQKNTLASLIDKTKTPMGSRLLRRWLHEPTQDLSIIKARQLFIESAISTIQVEPIQELLKNTGDCERVLARIALKSARPRDLILLRNLLAKIPNINSHLQQLDINYKTLPTLTNINELLQKAITENPPAVIREGGMIAEGYDTELDELRNLSDNAASFLIELETKEKARTNISTLKVGYNRIHGYYIEISRAQSDQAPVDYIRRQTLKNAERFITPELKQFEDKILSSKARALAREKALYDALLDQLICDIETLQTITSRVAEIDALASLSERADTLNWIKPQFQNEPGIEIKQGRHPVIEMVSVNPFIPNDVSLNQNNRMLMITGPNMGGKSTYMRQTAIIVLLCYIGAFVPAMSVNIGPIDRIFTRIGAQDDLSSGHSTFMVEMTETANILHNATDKSLVLMDEIGRGTSTFDGLSLAWACAIALADSINAFTLFSTHYFELTSLADEHASISNVHLDASEYQDELVFLHQVKQGPANQSFGIHVAKLAGLPGNIIALAKSKLTQLENQSLQENNVSTPIQGDLLSHSVAENPVIEKIKSLNVDDLTAKKALDLLYELKTDCDL